MTDAKLYQVEDGWMETYTGQQFHFKGEIDPEEIHIWDIAHALSLLCRYNGHTIKFYSVAEHSVIIALYLKALGYDDRIALTGLMHETSETYIGDLARPVKEVMPDFKAMEERIDIAVAKRFGTIWPFPQIVKELDTRILVDERVQVMNASNNIWGTDAIEPLGVTIESWSPRLAESEFIETFRNFTLFED